MLRLRGKGVWIGAALVCAGIAAIGVAVASSSSAPTHTRKENGLQQVATTRAVPTISSSDQAFIATEGLSFQPVTAASVTGAMTTDSGVAAARAFGLVRNTTLVSATLGRLTDEHLNKVDPSEPRVGDTAPDVNNRLVWFVIFDGVQQPSFGGGIQATAAPLQPAATSRMWVAVDASTGKMLEASTMNS